MGADRTSIEEIASSFDISRNHLVKVVHNLGRLGFIETTRGRGGGIKLARAAEDINMGDVIRKTESNLEVVECMNQSTNTCPIIGACGLKPWLAQAMHAFLTVLDGVTLADIVQNRKKIARTLGISAAE